MHQQTNHHVPPRPCGPEVTGETRDSAATLSTDKGLLERRYAIARQYNEQGVCVYDQDQCLVLANAQYATIYGLNPDHIVVGMSLRDVLRLRIEKGVYGSSGAAAYKREWLRNVTRRRTRIQDLTDGRCILVVQQPTTNGQWIATHEDITERLRTEAHMSFLATRDPLTGLANRAALSAHLSDATAAASSRQRLGVMLLDLDKFKAVNDTYGHDVGDEVLRIAAARIRCHVRDTDTVARLGGDEFVVIHAPVSSITSIATRASNIVAALSRPFITGSGSITIGASAGLVVTGTTDISPDELLKATDTELYRAKRAGRGTYRICDLSNPNEHTTDDHIELSAPIATETK